MGGTPHPSAAPTPSPQGEGLGAFLRSKVVSPSSVSFHPRGSLGDMPFPACFASHLPLSRLRIAEINPQLCPTNPAELFGLVGHKCPLSGRGGFGQRCAAKQCARCKIGAGRRQNSPFPWRGGAGGEPAGSPPAPRNLKRRTHNRRCKPKADFEAPSGRRNREQEELFALRRILCALPRAKSGVIRRRQASALCNRLPAEEIGNKKSCSHSAGFCAPFRAQNPV